MKPRATIGTSLVLALPLILAGGACRTSSTQADVVLTGRFVTLDPARPEAEAVAVRDGRIVAIGTRAEVDGRVETDVRRVELSGVALPGFAEGHGHVEALGRQLELVDLQRLSREEILHRVADAARELEPGKWIQGRGWDQGFWERQEFPTAAEIDAVASYVQGLR